MEATDGRRVGAAGGGRQLLGSPADVPVALFLPAEFGFQPGSRRRTVSVPRAQRAAARPAEASGAPHPHPRTPGRQRAAPAAAPAGRRPPARRAASVKRPPLPGAPRLPLPPAARRARGFAALSRGPPVRLSLAPQPVSPEGPNAKSTEAQIPGRASLTVAGVLSPGHSIWGPLPPADVHTSHPCSRRPSSAPRCPT